MVARRLEALLHVQPREGVLLRTAHGAIYEVSAAGGEIRKVAGDRGPQCPTFRSAPMVGVWLLWVSQSTDGEGVVQRSYSQPDLFVTAVELGSPPKNLTADYDFDIAGGVGGDQGPPRGGGGSKPFWSADGRNIFVQAAEQGRVNIKRIDSESGKVAPVTQGDHAVISYSATPDGSKMAMLVSTPTNIGDVFVMNGRSGEMQPVTHVNAELFAKLNLTEPETIWYKSFDGRRIQAWVQRPPDFEAGKKYPMILDIHGGPHSAYGYIFDHEFQWMAAKGYVVLYPNPRGSTSYGQEFGNIIQYNYPGDDFKDLMAGVDELIARGWVDPRKARRHRRQRRRSADELGDRPHGPLQGRGLAAIDRRLGRLLVHGGFLAVHADVVSRRALGTGGGFQGAIAHHLYPECAHAR